MAGSYRHLLSQSGNGSGWTLIENMGDAYECVEELFWLVERAVGRENAIQFLESEFYPMIRREIPKDEAAIFVKQQMDYGFPDTMGLLENHAIKKETHV